MSQDLCNKTILVASGPTFAPLDAVRALTNRSTGRLGSAVGRELAMRGASVLFLAGETSFTPSMLYPDDDLPSIREERFYTVDHLRAKLRETLQGEKVDAVLMAAAVLDYIPVGIEDGKKRSDADEWVIRLKKGEKIIERIRDWAPNVYLVGFKLEAKISLDALRDRAEDLMNRSGARLVVANRIEEIQGERHVAYLIQRSDDGAITASSPLTTRNAIAEGLADKLAVAFLSPLSPG